MSRIGHTCMGVRGSSSVRWGVSASHSRDVIQILWPIVHVVFDPFVVMNP